MHAQEFLNRLHYDPQHDGLSGEESIVQRILEGGAVLIQSYAAEHGTDSLKDLPLTRRMALHVKKVIETGLSKPEAKALNGRREEIIAVLNDVTESMEPDRD